VSRQALREHLYLCSRRSLSWDVAGQALSDQESKPPKVLRRAVVKASELLYCLGCESRVTAHSDVLLIGQSA
jgi:hypothetical protein